ncbi:FAD-binding protein, partial [bacterium]|nr:FAD-binding protein [bacterium]
SSTFWSAMGFIDSDYAIQLDMRRMRKIEIDDRNMFAVVEPYAIGAVVQAEAMKVGLTLNVPGVGCSSSPLASTAGWVGFGPTSISMGCASENMLGAEWVLPDGEGLRTGSLGAGAGWFCGEGPGPSTRGWRSASIPGRARPPFRRGARFPPTRPTSPTTSRPTRSASRPGRTMPRASPSSMKTTSSSSATGSSTCSAAT